MPALTWIRYYRVAPDRNDELLRATRTSFDTLLADKKIVTWGILVPVTHIGEEWTHVVYASVDDWAAIEWSVAIKVLPPHLSSNPALRELFATKDDESDEGRKSRFFSQTLRN